MNDTVKSNAQLNDMDVDTLLSLGIDEIADLEGYKPITTAYYGFDIVSATMEEVGANNAPVIKLGLAITSVEETTKDTVDEDLPSELPHKYEETYFLAGKDRIGLKAFVTMFRPLAVNNGWRSTNEIIAGIIGYSGKGVIKKTGYFKKDSEGNKTDEWVPSNQLDITTVTFD